MNDTIFCNSFAFNNFHFTNYKYTDNSAGIHIHYFAYMTRGHAKICAENETVAIREGDIFYIPHGCQYRSYWYGDPDIEFISLGFRFLPNFKGRYYPPQVIARNEAAVQMMQSLVRRPPDEAAVGEFYTLTSLLMPSTIPVGSHAQRRSTAQRRRSIVAKRRICILIKISCF